MPRYKAPGNGALGSLIKAPDHDTNFWGGAVISAFDDPLGGGIVIQFSGRVDMQFCWRLNLRRFARYDLTGGNNGE